MCATSDSSANFIATALRMLGRGVAYLPLATRGGRALACRGTWMRRTSRTFTSFAVASTAATDERTRTHWRRLLGCTASQPPEPRRRMRRRMQRRSGYVQLVTNRMTDAEAAPWPGSWWPSAMPGPASDRVGTMRCAGRFAVRTASRF